MYKRIDEMVAERVQTVDRPINSQKKSRNRTIKPRHTGFCQSLQYVIGCPDGAFCDQFIIVRHKTVVEGRQYEQDSDDQRPQQQPFPLVMRRRIIGLAQRHLLP